MSAVLTTDLLERITPPPGEVGEAQAWEFDLTIQRAVGTCNVADARLVALVRRSLLEGWWRHRGCHSPEHWVAAQLGLDSARARRVVRIAIYWEHGGPTDLANLFAACPTDHKLIHRGDIQVIRDPLDPTKRIFLDRNGRPLPRPGPLPPPFGPPPAEPYRGPARGRMPRWYQYTNGRRAA